MDLMDLVRKRKELKTKGKTTNWTTETSDDIARHVRDRKWVCGCVVWGFRIALRRQTKRQTKTTGTAYRSEL